MNRPTHFDDLADDTALKACCAAIYESDWARLLLGDSYHPGGLALTGRLGQLLELTPDARLLDVGAGNGASARYLGQRFGCHVVGLDYSHELAAEANELATAGGVAGQIRFEQGDAESLPFPDHSFDAILCECTFCTFPDKEAAANEFARVLKPGGLVGISDLTRAGSLPDELESLLAWVACIADARPVEEYAAWLERAGLAVDHIEHHDDVLQETVKAVRARLVGANLLLKLKQIELPGADFDRARTIARSAETAVRQGKLGYAIIIGARTR